jgi:hypothetical protein
VVIFCKIKHLFLIDDFSLRKLLEEMEKLGGIEECPIDYNQIKIKFVNPSQTESQLYITFTLCHDSVGDVKLNNVEVN